MSCFFDLVPLAVCNEAISRDPTFTFLGYSANAPMGCWLGGLGLGEMAK